MKKVMLIVIAMMISVSGFGIEEKFFNNLPFEAKTLIEEKIRKVVPVYSKAVTQVLNKIDALEDGTVSESTSLAEVPIKNLFKEHSESLRKVLDEEDFTGGRGDHDIAWLRESKVEMDLLLQLVEVDGNKQEHYSNIDSYFTNKFYHVDDNGDWEVNVDLLPMSRFYCNLSIWILKESGTLKVRAVEKCD